ncbi:MAG: universal stress protein [Propionibacteriaceae bacterium]
MTTDAGNYVVAYEATQQGNDAVELAVALARLTGDALRICLVLTLPTSIPAKVPANTGDFESLLESQALAWLAEAQSRVPDDVIASTHLLWAESTSEGLIRAAEEFRSDRIVVGASRRGLLGRFTIGSVANALLHASHVPVALAPRGYTAPERITRITCAIGTRPGWQALLDSVAALSAGLVVDLRFVTLVEVDAGHGHHAIESSGDHLVQVLDYFTARSTAQGQTQTSVAHGAGVEAAVDGLDWRPDELAFVGSSRLAQPSRIFLGVTASRMLHSLPVPLVVVPTQASSTQS